MEKQTNEPAKQEDSKATPTNETPAEEKAAHAHKQLNIDGETALQDADKKIPNQSDKAVPTNSKQNNQAVQAEQAVQDKKPLEEKPPEVKPSEGKPPRRGRPPSAEKPEPTPKSEKSEKADVAQKSEQKPKPEKPSKNKQGANVGNASKKPKGAEKPKSAEKPEPEPSEVPPPPPEPKEAPRTGEQEQIVYINLSELHHFKDHPFQVKNDDEMKAMVESVKDKGVTQPAIVRPREEGGYEIVSGHRRETASKLANFTNMPCIVRNLTDEQAITQMVEDNTNQRENILPSERANALKMQLDAIKRQGARDENGGNGQRSNEIVAERNKMTVKQVQRFIKLTELVPDLQKMVDEKKIAFTPAVELAFIKPKNQAYIAVAIEGQQSAPSLSQAQRMRELDKTGVLNPDVIDGIMLEEKKEADKVILSSQELGKYFGKEKTPREMKDQILKLLDEYKEKNPPVPAMPPKHKEK
jgi:ParB/RepB/Spo0J family partition protein